LTSLRSTDEPCKMLWADTAKNTQSMCARKDDDNYWVEWTNGKKFCGYCTIPTTKVGGMGDVTFLHGVPKLSVITRVMDKSKVLCAPKGDGKCEFIDMTADLENYLTTATQDVLAQGEQTSEGIFDNFITSIFCQTDWKWSEYVRNTCKYEEKAEEQICNGDFSHFTDDKKDCFQGHVFAHEYTKQLYTDLVWSCKGTNGAHDRIADWDRILDVIVKGLKPSNDAVAILTGLAKVNKGEFATIYRGIKEFEITGSMLPPSGDVKLSTTGRTLSLTSADDEWEACPMSTTTDKNVACTFGNLHNKEVAGVLIQTGQAGKETVKMGKAMLQIKVPKAHFHCLFSLERISHKPNEKELMVMHNTKFKSHYARGQWDVDSNLCDSYALNPDEMTRNVATRHLELVSC